MNQEELNEIIENHKLWLDGKGGEQADLRWAALSGCDLRGAALSGCDLRGADLYGCDLRGANLQGADLYGCDLRRTKNIMRFGPMMSSGRICYAVAHSDKIMFQAGCFWGTAEELEEKVKNDQDRWDYMLAIEWARKAFSQERKG